MKGDWLADSDSSFVYLSPLASGKVVHVAPMGTLRYFLHEGEERDEFTGLSFETVAGDTVYAMRGGFVCEVEDNNSSLGRTADDGKTLFSRNENFVVICHKDGSMASYKLFKDGGIFVKSGDKVYAGQPLGIVGGENYQGGSHLRLQLEGCFDDDSAKIVDGKNYRLFVPVIAVSDTETCKPVQRTEFMALHPQKVIMQEMSKKERKQYLKQFSQKK